MTSDPEILLMGLFARRMDKLSIDQQHRILEWIRLRWEEAQRYQAMKGMLDNITSATLEMREEESRLKEVKTTTEETP